MRNTILCIFFLSFFSISFSQNHWCGTTLNDEEYKSEFRIKKNYRSKRKPIKIGLSIYAFGTLGKNHIPIDTIYNSVAYLNTIFAEANMSFFILGDINFIDSERLYYFDINEDSNDQNEIDQTYSINGAINIYYVGPVNQGSNFPTGWCGQAYFPDEKKDKIILSNFCASSKLLAHEMGHIFSLFHTHETSFGKELVNKSNCLYSGDKICDTPADPGINQNNVSDDCDYLAKGLVDANGEVYVPSVENLMSYAPDKCRSTFTDGQIEHMLTAYNTFKTHLIQTPYLALFSSIDTVICSGKTINFIDNSFGAVNYFWSFEGGVPSTSTDQNPSVMYSQIGDFDVSLKITDEYGNSDEKVLYDYIKVSDKVESDSVSLKESFEDINNIDKKVINKDYSTTFELTNKASSDGKQSVWMDFFNYESSKGEFDYLLLGTFNNKKQKMCYVSFDYAYAAYDNNNIDGLALVYRDQCGEWITIWEKYGQELQTVEPISNQVFIPTKNQWSNIKIPIELPEGTATVEFAFKAISGWGNALYLDNYQITPIPKKPIIYQMDDHLVIQNNEDNIQWFINGDSIFNANQSRLHIKHNGSYKVKVSNEICSVESKEFIISEIVSMTNLLNSQFKIYPNPASTDIYINIPTDFPINTINEINIKNFLGQVILQSTYSSKIDVSSLTKGIYFIELITNNFKLQKKIFID